MKILDAVGLEHIGSYASDAEKSEIKLITVRGIRIAVLAYTYGCNMTKEEFFYQAENSYITNVLASPSSPYFQLAKGRVLLDFDRAKALSPDLIIVLPHMGAQFRHDISTYQQTWNRIFIQAGADIIIGDHAHAVQPLTLETNGGKTIAIANCPGNFANSYIENDGDATALLKCIFLPKVKK